MFLFGASKIPSWARSIGEARREFSKAMRGEVSPETSATPLASSAIVPTPTAQANPVNYGSQQTDPLLAAAEKEGINVNGKTREQLASELAWKLNKK